MICQICNKYCYQFNDLEGIRRLVNLNDYKLQSFLASGNLSKVVFNRIGEIEISVDCAHCGYKELKREIEARGGNV